MVFDKLAALISTQFDVSVDEITMDTDFVGDLNATSIDIVELMLDIESEFDLDEIEDDALEKVHTVGDVVNYISDRI